MTVQQMKDAILDVYRTRSWRNKVEAMYDDQIIAIYYNFSKRGILGKVMRRENTSKVRDEKPKEPECCQLSIFDIYYVEDLENEYRK